MSKLSAQEIVELSKRYTLFDWQAQSKAAPLAVERAKGMYFWTVDGTRYLDFNSQLMGLNIGHGDPRVIEAIAHQASKLAYISPFMAYEERALLGRKMAEILPGDIEKTFYTLGGAEANENAIKIARLVTGRHKIVARYRSYHGATTGAMTLTGDPRRWPNEPAMVGVVHVLDPYHGPDRPTDDAATALAYLEETIELEGPGTIAAFILETVTGTNGILIPPDGYLQGVRELCDRHGILLIADEIMCGFGRTGEWFAVNHWDVVPDIISLAKGLTSSYAPLGALGLRPHVAGHFDENVFWGGLTYNTHPISVAAALATIRVYEEDGLIENARKMGEVMARHHRELKDKHPSVGHARNIGLFGILELVKNARNEPLSPFNVQNETMAKVNRFLLDNGLYTMVRWWNVMTIPPLIVTEQQLGEGFEIIDRALEIADQAFEG
ncbi:MAG TPA: aminotransferase class III-fold pyridoxal phosphate-dependent enzyme [Actinomycetota bacterium]|jgi:taurine--2-oxoglutarate transaminase|nr:aminotransferase class III-fold pyridoxal phosphate-dependent enzyme [Actinomycetota bacterium]